jgi:signal transduction histidine kinase
MRTWPGAGDAALAAGFALIGVLLAVGTVDGRAVWPAVALTVVHSAALAWRRQDPVAVLAVMGATGAVTVLAGWPPVILGPAVLAAVHALGAAREPRSALPVVGAAVVVMAALVSAADADASTVVGNGLAFAVAWFLGDRQRLARTDVARAEAASAERARQAVAEERLRIARELHDVVAHALSVIAVQAGTGRVLIDTDATTARQALASIETESRSALGEMRRLLDVLRDDGDPAAGDLAPSPGLDDLEDLVAATARTGLPVAVRMEGERVPLPVGAELAAYRIVQEALTNVRRHATGATEVQVRVAWVPGAIDVEVLDDGTPVEPVVPGNGLIGMRERASLYGGSVEAAARPDGGFRVAARIPCGDGS